MTRKGPPPAQPGYQSPRAWSQSEAPETRTGRPAHQPAPQPPRQSPPPPIVAYNRPRPPEPPRDRPPRPADRFAPPPPSRTRRKRRIPILRTVLILLLVMVLGTVGLFVYFDTKLNRVDALSNYEGRVAGTPGTNWLLVGSDSRADLSEEERAALATGDSEGSRTDTIMLVHFGSGGKPMIISIPRDLFVDIPGNGAHKINAAFSIGGPELLVQTIETNTGVHIDHYAEIGFGGFDKLVDAVGGIEMCLDAPINDPLAGIDLQAGCQTLNGKEALGFVRTRAFANADLDRVVNQRKFMAALMQKATSFSTILNPFRFWPLVSGTVGSLTVDNGDHIWHLARLAWALRSDPVTVTTPNGGPVFTDDGDSLAWGDNTTAFFAAIADGKEVPPELIQTGG
ncbi:MULTISPECIES: LCP family protein [Mycobacteriales]|uniref:LCP family protein n=1 Tax=Gordonia rubripertincta TaxID=36822 RepID=A0ABT4MT26_GORRU|nr:MULTISPECIES: LCP family protein [Mycobacteriales]MCZ4549406.1 LCP family protein [Gordonia rubripertincta]